MNFREREKNVPVILFALTGIGNVVLQSLLDNGIRPDLLVTRDERGAYPYEEIPFIGELASSHGVPWNTGLPDEQVYEASENALLLVATYHRIIRSEVFNSFKAAINLHPSLLPRYRGANPFLWAIRNGDQFAGVTAHALTEGVDDGPICLQESINIFPTETQTSLRSRLAEIAGGLAVEVVQKFAEGTLTFAPQDHELATAFPRLEETGYQIDVSARADEIRRHVNALRDWPLARLGIRRIRSVKGVSGPSAVGIGTVLSEREGECVVRVRDADIILEVSVEGSGSALA